VCVRTRCWGEFGYKREEVTGNGKKLHSKKHRNLYTSPYLQIKQNEMGGGNVARMKMRNAHKILVGKSKEEIQFGTRRRMWEENIEVDLRM